MHSILGTPGYMAPEMFLGRGYEGPKIDVFAAGVCLFMLLTSNVPFTVAKATDQYYRLLAQKPKEFWRIHSAALPTGPGAFSDELKDLITRML